jgi:hypothetical protein
MVTLPWLLTACTYSDVGVGCARTITAQQAPSVRQGRETLREIRPSNEVKINFLARIPLLASCI